MDDMKKRKLYTYTHRRLIWQVFNVSLVVAVNSCRNRQMTRLSFQEHPDVFYKQRLALQCCICIHTSILLQH